MKVKWQLIVGMLLFSFPLCPSCVLFATYTLCLKQVVNNIPRMVAKEFLYLICFKKDVKHLHRHFVFGFQMCSQPMGGSNTNFWISITQYPTFHDSHIWKRSCVTGSLFKESAVLLQWPKDKYHRSTCPRNCPQCSMVEFEESRCVRRLWVNRKQSTNLCYLAKLFLKGYRALHFLPVNWDHSHPWFTQKSCH